MGGNDNEVKIKQHKRSRRDTTTDTEEDGKHRRNKCKRNNKSDSSTSSSPERRKHKRSKYKTKRSSSSSSSTSEERYERKKRKKEKRKLKKELKKQRKKEQEKKAFKSSEAEGEECHDVPVALMEKAKAMAPMTKEEWEKRQSVVRRVYDEESGRHRLIKGDGEVIEEIVSRDRHKAINKQATQGDGSFFQSKLSSSLNSK